MSTLYVDNLEPNLGSQVEIPDLKPLTGSVVNVTRWTTSSFNGTVSSNSHVNIANTSISAKAGNIMHVSGVFPTRGSASSGWNLTILKIVDSVDGNVFWSGYEGIYGANTHETISHIPINFSWVWGGTGQNSHTLNVHVRAYDGNLRRFGTSSQTNDTTTPVLTFTEIAQ